MHYPNLLGQSFRLEDGRPYCVCCSKFIKDLKKMKQHAFGNGGGKMHKRKLAQFGDANKASVTIKNHVEAYYEKTGAIGRTLPASLHEFRTDLVAAAADANISTESLDLLTPFLQKWAKQTVGGVDDLAALTTPLVAAEKEDLWKELGDEECFEDWSSTLDGSPKNYMEAEGFMVRKVSWISIMNMSFP